MAGIVQQAILKHIVPQVNGVTPLRMLLPNWLRGAAVGKTAICDLNIGSVSPVFRCIETEFGIRQQHPKRVKSTLS